MSQPGRFSLIDAFARHRVAFNLLMVMMILSGVWALQRLNTQFFPNFALDFVTVRVAWTGATAEDVETAIVDPIEEELRTLDGLRTLSATASEGRASFSLEYEQGTDMGVALDQVKERVALVRNLPAAAEEPEISRVVRYEPVARVLVSGPSESSLRPIVRRFERELLDRGIAKVAITGLPDEEIAVQVPAAALRELEMSVADVARRIAELSRDIPAGTIGRGDAGRQLRALEQKRSATDFEGIPLVATESGHRLELGEVATIERRARALQTTVRFGDRPAVELYVKRAETADSLESARILDEWQQETRASLPPGVEVLIFDESWRLIRERILLLLRNGAGGLVLVVLVLYLFLDGRVAFWVAAGIPISFMAALGVLYAIGGSINMVSLFALIMALGIIVDDAIVVGEDALAHYRGGEDPLTAAEAGAHRMLAPVFSSSLTTIAAFLPLMLVSGIIGNILFDIPLVVVCVILASLVESFLVLPGHLRASFRSLEAGRESRLRTSLERRFAAFRERVFRPLVTLSVDNPATVLSVALALLVLCAGLLAGGRIPFNFFPATEGTIVSANVSFVAGTPARRVAAYVEAVRAALDEAERALGEKVVRTVVVRLGSVTPQEGQPAASGDQYASMMVELEEPDHRTVRNAPLLEAWRERVPSAPGLESLTLLERRGGPPGRDVDVRLTGADATTVKAAALDLAQALRSVRGVVGVEDDMPYGKQQLVYRLTAEGEVLGLTVDEVGRQLRGAFDGSVAQIFQDGDDELEVRVILTDDERDSLLTLDRLNIALPGGGSVPLATVIELRTRRGFETLRHIDGELAVRVSADVDNAVTNNNDVIASLEAGVLPVLKQRHGVDFAFEGRRADQVETLADMRTGALFALGMIYLVLAWVFASYGWPLVVMAAIPFGLTGAIAGHWLLGIDLTILSLFGFFGLSGIVVNDSIILVTFYKDLRERGTPVREALVESSCQRLRAVLLTSLTTIGGLTPLMFERSLQAQFLIPMAVSISFGLAFATVLVLLLVPALLLTHESAASRLPGARERFPGPLPGARA